MTNSQADNRVEFVSKSAQTVMIELYSSQGCSSCPPAERWISQFIDDNRLWRDYVPIVFHVDYWNDLGWIDVFSNAENSKRQREYYAQKKIKSVYTPGLIINGKEWRGGDYFLNEKHPGVLRATLNDRQLAVRFENKKNLVLHVAILGTGLKTEVSHGENRNKQLSEDFVALSHQKMKSENGTWKVELPDRIDQIASRFGIAIWVSYPGMNTPIQSTGGWLPEKLFQG